MPPSLCILSIIASNPDTLELVRVEQSQQQEVVVAEQVPALGIPELRQYAVLARTPPKMQLCH